MNKSVFPTWEVPVTLVHGINFSAHFNKSNARISKNLNIDEIFYTLMDGEQKDNHISTALEVVLSFLGIILNVFIIVVNMTIPSLRIVKTNYFIMSLSVSDLLVSGVVMVFSILLRTSTLSLSHEDGFKTPCYLWATISSAACTASSLNVCAISVDRYILITRPLHYDVYITKERINIVLVFIWAISFVTAFVTFQIGLERSHEKLEFKTFMENTTFNSNYSITLNSSYIGFIAYCNHLPSRLYIVATVVLVVILPCVIVIFVYLKIFRLVIKQIKFIRKETEQANRLRVLESRRLRSGFSLISIRKKLISSELACQMLEPTRRQWLKLQKLGSVDEDKHKSPKLVRFVPRKGTSTDVETLNYVSVDNPNTSVSDIAKKDKKLSKSQTNTERLSKCMITDGYPSSFHGNVGLDNKSKYQGESPYSSRSHVQHNEVKTTSTQLNAQAVRESDSDYISAMLKQISREGAQKRIRKNTFAVLISHITSRVSIASNPELKAALVLMFIAGTYVICWLPFGIVSLIQTFRPHLVSPNLRENLLWLAYSNSCWNPLVYALLNKNFRLSIFEFLVKHGCVKDTESQSVIYRPSSTVHQEDMIPGTTFHQSLISASPVSSDANSSL